MNRIAVSTRPKTALVLSAGGMFGAYQAGVWDYLSGFLSPDIVVGASVGSLNGWLIADGCDGAELTNRWMNLQHLASPRFRLPRSWSEGILDSSGLEDIIRRMWHAGPLQSEFGVVLTRLPRMTPKLFRSPEITWQHIAGSCAVPLFLPHHRLDGNLYSDGGLLDPLPVWAAIEMGATSIIAVNLLKHRPWYLTAALAAAQAYSGHDNRRDREFVSMIEIAPAAPLGTARDSLNWTRENAGRWIESGRVDAQAALPAIVECVNRSRNGGLREGSSGCPLIVSTV